MYSRKTNIYLLKNNTFFLSFPLPKLLKPLLLKQFLAVISVKDSAPYTMLALEIQYTKLSFWDIKTKIYPSLLFPQTVFFPVVLILH